MDVRKVLVTPEMAKQILEKNKMNRKARFDRVNQYAKAIQNDSFREDTGELIKLSKEGNLLDGQHRLLAVIKANKPCYFHIAYGLDETIFSVIDSGAVRSSNDVFQINKCRYPSLLPSIIQRVNLLENGVKAKGFNKEWKLTNDELLDVYSSDIEKWNNVCLVGNKLYVNFNKVLAPSIMGSFFHIFSQKNTTQANEFMTQFSTGENVKNGVIYLLRNRFIKDRMSINKLPVNVKDALIIKAWNCYRTDKSPKSLSFNPETDTYPTIL